MSTKQYRQISTQLQTVLTSVAHQAGRRSGFVQRRSKVTAEKFVQMLVLSCLGHAQVTLREMAAMGEEIGVCVSVPGLDQRINAAAVALLQRVLQAALTLPHAPVSEGCACLAHFGAVHIHDSTQVSLPAHLAEVWAGSGGAASPAAVKVWLSYEYRSGTLAALETVAGRTPDQAYPLLPHLATPTSLHLFDLGFYTLEHLAQLAAGGSFFVCRHHSQTALYTADGQRLDLVAYLAQSEARDVELALAVGARLKLPVRLIARRLPQAVVAQRRAKARANARRQGRMLSAQTRFLLAWQIYCTNVPDEWWDSEQVVTAYRLRWQIELLFKLFKTQAGLAQVDHWRRERVLCQLYARLIALVLAQHILAPWRFAGVRELSLPKAFACLQWATLDLARALVRGTRQLAHVLAHLVARWQRFALKDARRTNPSTYARLCALAL